MLKNASTRELLADLQTADRMNQVVSAEAEHFLLALEIALRGNDELDFCGDAKMRMAELQSLVARVLKRRRESIVGAAVGHAGAAAAAVVGAMEGGNARSVRERVFDACVRKCTSALVATGTISDALLHDVFHELITVVEFDAQYNAAQVAGFISARHFFFLFYACVSHHCCFFFVSFAFIPPRTALDFQFSVHLGARRVLAKAASRANSMGGKGRYNSEQ
jgi:hypothetical protein